MNLEKGPDQRANWYCEKCIKNLLLAEWVLWNIANLKEYGHRIYLQDNHMVQDFVRSPCG